MNKQKLKEKRHVCRVCGSKLYESSMLIFGRCKNGMPVWGCRDPENFVDSCFIKALSTLKKDNIKLDLRFVNQSVTDIS